MKKLLFACTVVLLAACGDNTTNSVLVPDFTGSFAMAGTIDGSPSSTISGSLVISGESGATVNVMQSTTFAENGQAQFTVLTASPVPGAIQSNGIITWTVNTSVSSFQATGTLVGNVITGTWTFTSGAVSTSGQFTAQR